MVARLSEETIVAKVSTVVHPLIEEEEEEEEDATTMVRHQCANPATMGPEFLQDLEVASRLILPLVTTLRAFRSVRTTLRQLPTRARSASTLI